MDILHVLGFAGGVIVFFVTLYCRFVMQIYWLILNYQLFTRFFFDEKEIV